MTFAAIIIFILALCALIVVHEAGHFFAAKLFGIKVEEFSIGFGKPRIFYVRLGETEYSFRAWLIGGYVRIWGEEAEVAEGGLNKQKEAALETGEPYWRNFATRSVWIKSLVIIAGIVMNLVFAWVLIAAVYMIGMPSYISSLVPGAPHNAVLKITYVEPNSPAQKAGVESGDTVTSIQTATTSLNTFTAAAAVKFVQTHPDSNLALVVTRNGQLEDFTVRPAPNVITGEPDQKAIGVEFDDVGTALSFFSAITTGVQSTWGLTILSVESLGTFFGRLFTGHANFSNISGPVGIVVIGSQSVAAGWSLFLLTVALVSISLALINIIPIPGLDGGRLLFIIIEGVRGRPVSEEAMIRSTIAGFSLIGILFVLVTYHDILRYIAPHI